MDNPGPLVEAHALTKHYGRLSALEDCTFSVHPGEVFGLLGPNGSGKTTLLRLLLGFLRPTRGHVTIAQHDCYWDSVAVHAGYKPQTMVARPDEAWSLWVYQDGTIVDLGLGGQQILLLGLGLLCYVTGAVIFSRREIPAPL